MTPQDSRFSSFVMGRLDDDVQSPSSASRRRTENWNPIDPRLRLCRNMLPDGGIAKTATTTAATLSSRRWRRCHPKRFYKTTSLAFILFFLISWMSSFGTAQAVFAPLFSHCPTSNKNADAYRPLRENEICPSLDMRNHVANLSELDGCQVVEGFVHIVLMEEPGAHFLNQTYPLLREITGYLLVYRVQGLRSIGQLFPNLAVIRGQQLFFDFSLVIYENMQLQEIGLKSLTELQYGSVMIEKNPNLCYAETIDWGGRIGRPGRERHLIESNKANCPKCPDRCPAGNNGNRLCWSNDDCQKVCDGCSGACSVTHPRLSEGSNKFSCCHEECAGGCDGPESNQCKVCKNVLHNGECRHSCPPNYYLYLKRRCLTDSECTSLPPPRDRCDATWKAFKDECILDCPPGFQEERVQYNSTFSYSDCVPCKGKSCPKICDGALVNNIETVQKYKGCTIVRGDLDIQNIKGGENIIKELEQNLGDIEEIRGILKVVRSFPLLSLNFLKSLRNITGRLSTSKPRDLEGDGEIPSQEEEYALVVQENQNLQKLWSHQNVTIYKKISFHFNPRLCMSLIEELHNSSRPPGSKGALSRFSETDVSPWSNGDKATCDEQVLNVSVVMKKPTMMLLQWNNFRATLADKRQLLGYIISYVETDTLDVTYYDGRDACGGDGWTVDDVSATASKAEDFESHIITNMKPFTQYAIYVQTYTVAPQQTGKRVGARSPIFYERTRPAAPDSPEDLRAYANSSMELVIEWKPPKKPNGVVTHYVVIGSWGRDDQEWIDKQDACDDIDVLGVAFTSDQKKPSEDFSFQDNRTSIFFDPSRLTGGNASATAQSGSDGKCCECAGPNKDKLESKEKAHQYKIDFENFLHNKIYVKNPGLAARKKREIDLTTETGNNILPGNMNGNLPYEFPDPASVSGPVQGSVPLTSSGENHTDTFYQGHLETFRREVVATPDRISTTIHQLRHFSEYTIKVYACHDPEPDGSDAPTKLCSEHSVVTSARTKQSDTADEISGVMIDDTNSTTGSVKIGWNEPINPNGLIKKYQLEYKRTDQTNPKVKRECVRRKDFVESNRTRVLSDLSPGNYCIQVRAVSLAGPGPFTKEVCFFIKEAIPSSVSGGTIAGIFLLVFFIFITLAVVAGYYYMKIKKEKDINNGGIISVNPDYDSILKYIPDGWEVSRDNVELLQELGQGSFGMVYEGIVHNVVPNEPKAKCAVKTVNEKASIGERIQFLNEASVMKEFNAHHVVKLLGVVSKAQPTLVVMELMANGDLKTYLRSHRPDCETNVSEGRQPPTLKCILKMAIEIADGMAYLAEKKFVHRDLAARNCMVAEDLTVKIGDFGMTRDIYETDYYRKGGKGLLPVRWMPPESLRDGVFSSHSDVWSYGVVLWEMATLASQPYQGLSNDQVLKYVMDGGVMERPEGCPDRLYVLMEMCWRYQAKHRPSFLDIIEDLLPEVPPHFASVSFYHSDLGVAARTALKAQYEHETRLSNDPSTPLQEQLDELELEVIAGGSNSSSNHYLRQQHHFPSGEQILQMNDNRNGERDPVASGTEEGDDEEDETGAHADDRDEADDGEEDHVPVLYPYERQAYILVRNPGGHSTSNGNSGSRGDGSKGGNSAVSTVPSDDSKGSYVSNGSASGGNGYVMGILQQRRHNIAEPL